MRASSNIITVKFSRGCNKLFETNLQEKLLVCWDQD